MMGNALVGRLYDSLRRRKVAISVRRLHRRAVGDRNGVTGARVNLDGRDILVKTRKGVVLATGGYAHNKKFRDAFMPQPVPTFSMSAEGNDGDGVALGEKFGARLSPSQGSSGLWTPVSRVPRADGSTGLFPHLVLDRAKPGLIAVNAAGRRFVNEACSYHDFVLAMFETHEREPAIPAYLICDAVFIRRYGLGAVYPGGGNFAGWKRAGILFARTRSKRLPASRGQSPHNCG